ncbi:MAG TPA: biotin/lipoyl-binding protein [Mycobacteriales bacterium]|nr:biotin/lipoyl-binding protein [Mycobacteriales bacterium]
MRSRGRWIGAAVVVAVLGGGGTAYGLARGPGHSYRTAIVGVGSVTQTVAATGSVTPVSAADVSFQVAGTVAKVLVKVGQRVHSGQVIAHLDRSPLRDALRSAQSSLSAARSRLSADESGQGSAASSRQPTLQADHPTVSPAPTPGPGRTGGLAQQQAAVRAAQQATDADLTASRQALAAAQTACAETSPSPQSTGATGAPSTAPTAAPPPSPADGSDDASCTTASATLLAAQQQVDQDESRLAAAEAALSGDLAAIADAATSTGSSPSKRSPTGSSNSAASAPASAAQIAFDQASIDQAVAQVSVAKADLAQATLRSTIDGTVAAATLAHGDRVNASSSDGLVKILGSRQEQATIAVSATQIRRIDVGMPAEILPDGSGRSMQGQVVAIDTAGVTSQSGTTSYPVTIALPRDAQAVSGAAAAVTVVVSSVDDVLTVPTSAVHHTGTRSYVEVLNAGKLGRRSVTVGAVGAALTQIVSGLQRGQVVVLADLNEAVPSSSSNLGGGGGFFGRGGGGGQRFARQFISDNGGGSVTVGPPSG